VPGKPAVEIFRQRLGDARIDALAQCFANVEVPETRNGMIALR
jgi:hypothetical protein